MTDQAYNFAYLDEQTKRMTPPRDPEGHRRAGLSGAFCQPRNADALWLGHGRGAGDSRLSDAG